MLAAAVVIAAAAFIALRTDKAPAPNAVEPTAPNAVEPTAQIEISQADNQGVFENSILFGQTAAFSGPAAALGIGMRDGILAAFEEKNRAGGVHNRQLLVKSLDDTYEPELAIENAQRLIDQDGVFALIGSVGTPTSRSTAPVALAAGVPLVGPFTGAAILRDASFPNIVNLRASYAQEAEAMVQRLFGEQGNSRIAVVYQDDSFGRTGYEGVLSALARRNLEPVSVGLYTRNTLAVKTAFLDVAAGNPDAIIVIGPYQPTARLVELADKLDLQVQFMAISFVGTNALADQLGPLGEGVQITQVVPFPTDAQLPITAQYLQALADHDPAVQPGFVSFEGYLAGRMTIAALELCGPELDRECFLASLPNNGPIDLGGFALEFGSGDNQGSDAVFLTVINSDGRVEPALVAG